MLSMTTLLAKRRLAVVLVLSSLCTFGCEPNKPAEVSSANSGYVPIDDSKAGKDSSASKASDSATNNTANSNAATTADAKVSSDSKRANGSASGTSVAPAIPEFSPGKTDAELAKRSFMQLKLPKDMTNQAELLKYLAENTKATSELISETNRKSVTREVGLERAVELGVDKIAAAEALMKISKDDEVLEGSIIAKFEALSQMMSLGDVSASDQLSEFAAEHSSSKYPEVAEQATALLISLSVNEMNKGVIPPEDLVKTLDKAFALKRPTATTLQVVAIALEHLKTKTGKSQFELAKKLENMFRNDEVNELSVAAFRNLLNHSESWTKLEASLTPTSPLIRKPTEVQSLLDAVLKDVEGDYLPLFLLNLATGLEYSGHVDVAKVLVNGAQSRIESISNARVKEEVSSNCESFSKRLSILGQELDFSGLAELDGKEFDFSQYAGKIVVVDFWATWCQPCLNEIPNLKKMLEAHQENGVEVLGVNLDEKREDFDVFLKSNPLPWKSVVSSDAENVGFKTPISQRLGITAIPFVLIIDRDGKVIALHARGRLLDQKIEELVAAGKVQANKAGESNAAAEPAPTPLTEQPAAAEQPAESEQPVQAEQPAEAEPMPVEASEEPAAQPSSGN